MACKESVCRSCFHSYVCEQFNENKDENNEKCHFFNDHYVPTADVVPKSEVERLTVELDAMRGAANTYKMHYENAIKEIERLKDYNTGVAFKHYFDGRKEVVREIFEEIEKTVFADMDFFKELKKKYTGEKE